MSGLDTIPVMVGGGCASELHTAANAVPVLHEIRHALETLATTGESTTIDLSAIPFGPGDREELFKVLGEGEVSATVRACSMGDTEIRETHYPGVWQIRHLGPSGEEIAMHIEITRMPALLITPEEDIADSVSALDDVFNHSAAAPVEDS